MQEAGACHAASAGGAGLVGVGVQGGERHGRLLQGVGSCRGLTSHQAPSAQLKGRIETGMRHAIPYLQFIPRRERSGESPCSSSPTCCSAVRDGGADSRLELWANKGTSLGVRQMHTHMGGKRGLAHETSDGDMLESPQTKRLCPMNYQHSYLQSAGACIASGISAQHLRAPGDVAPFAVFNLTV